MSDKKLSAELKEVKKARERQALKDSPVYQFVHGLWVFAEGVALLVTAVYAIYQSHYAHLPMWGRDVLVVSGALVLVPAGILLGKFFRQVGKA